MAKQTPRKKSSSSRRKTSASKAKKPTRKVSRTPRKKTTRRKRKKSLTLKHIILILSGLALLVVAISWGVLHYHAGKAPEKPSCRAHQKEITTLILSTLFQEGLSRQEVTWKHQGSKTSFTLKTKKEKFRKVYATLQKELPRKYKGIHIKKKGHETLIILCGRQITHRLAFIPPPQVTYPTVEHKPVKPKHVPPPAPPKKTGKKVKVAIVIDDIGNDLSIARDLMNLPAPVTLSIFPFAPHSKEIAKEATAMGHEILMHLPMEPEGYPGDGKDPGPGALYVKMTPEEIVQQLNKDLDQIPEICGINNHMGSRFTSYPEGMKAVMEVLKKRKKFFLDSKTASSSVGFRIAREEGIPTIKRDVFLDNVRDIKKIREQFERLVENAKRRGYAVGIGHPHRVTYLALKKVIPEYQKEGIEFVYVSSLVR